MTHEFHVWSPWIKSQDLWLFTYSCYDSSLPRLAKNCRTFGTAYARMQWADLEAPEEPERFDVFFIRSTWWHVVILRSHTWIPKAGPEFPYFSPPFWGGKPKTQPVVNWSWCNLPHFMTPKVPLEQLRGFGSLLPLEHGGKRNTHTYIYI